MSGKQSIMPVERIEQSIYVVRGHKVMLDADLAKLYGVQTKMLVRAMKRNIERFPPDFMFQLTKDEFDSLRFHFGTSNLRSQSGTSNGALGGRAGRGGRRTLPYAFTEQGVAMLSSVLNSERAIQVNILIMRAFTKLREMLYTHKDLRRKIEIMEKKYDLQFKVVFDAIIQLIDIESKPKRKIGFEIKEAPAAYSMRGKRQ